MSRIWPIFSLARLSNYCALAKNLTFLHRDVGDRLYLFAYQILDLRNLLLDCVHGFKFKGLRKLLIANWNPSIIDTEVKATSRWISECNQCFYHFVLLRRFRCDQRLEFDVIIFAAVQLVFRLLRNNNLFSDIAIKLVQSI